LLREFTDTSGVHWRVWDVNPTLHARPSSSMTKLGFRNVPAGWLCFESAGKRRRLSPVPENWTAVDDNALEEYCARAEPVRDTPR
jgi:hypothetical protein